MGTGDDDERRALREQIAALTAVVSGLSASIGTAARVVRAEPTITLATLFDAYDKTRAGEVGWRTNRYRLTALVRRLGELPACRLTPMAWAEHQAARAQEITIFKRPPSQHVLGVELGWAKALLKFGVTNGLLESNPLVAAKAPRTVSARETWLDEAGMQALLGGVGKISGDRNQVLMRAFILLCLDGMLRHDEARKLRRDQIRDGVIELSAKGTKSKRRRTVGLTPRVLRALADLPPVLGSPLVFANPKTKRAYAASSFRIWFRTACEASGVDALAAAGERVVIHTLRHSGASAADARGASPMAIKDCLGHSSLAITERYLHRHRDSGARDLAKLMADGAEKERRGPQSVNADDLSRSSKSNQNQ